MSFLRIESFFGVIDSKLPADRVSFRARLAMWRERMSSRKALKELDDRMLRDIGITARDARIESARPFWNGETAPYWRSRNTR